MHVWANRARADPAADLADCSVCGEKDCYDTALVPLVWNLGLARAARFHCDNLQLSGCGLQHNSPCSLDRDIGNLYDPGSCDGSPDCACQDAVACGMGDRFSTRVGLFGTSPAAENGASGGDPVSLHYRWLHERYTPTTCGYSGTPGAVNGHRYNILRPEARSIGVGANSRFAFQDFGRSGSADGLVAGAHYPQSGSSLEFRANWYRPGTAGSGTVNVGGVCRPMSLERGTSHNGTFLATVGGISGCTRYSFEFNGVRLPTTGSYGIGCGEDWSAASTPACGCTPSCGGRSCGDDGCGSSCGDCSGGRVCGGGSCLCPSGTEDCGGSCVDTASSAAHCGGCGRPCLSGQSCEANNCVCPSGEMVCGGACVNTATDTANCGDCGRMCLSGQSCQASGCVCPSGGTECAGACVDTAADTMHCGGCGRTCLADQTCEASGCHCRSGRMECGGACVDTETSTVHCGECRRPCAEGRACIAGTCEGGAFGDAGPLPDAGPADSGSLPFDGGRRDAAIADGSSSNSDGGIPAEGETEELLGTCSCRAMPGSTRDRQSPWLWLLSALSLGAIMRRRR